MFERYTERARRVLFFARYEAGMLGGNAIDPSHLLLGLIHENTGITSRIFARARLPLDRLRSDLQELTVAEPPATTSAEIPFSAETKRMLQLASQEADRFLHPYIGTEHLLLGVLRDEDSRATALLNHYGLRIDTVREDVVRLLNETQTPVRPQAPDQLARRGRPRRTDDPPADVPHAHVSATIKTEHERATETRGSFWTFEGMPLRVALSRVFNVPEDHIDLPRRLQDEDARYDLAVLAPGTENPQQMQRLLQNELEKHFDVSITREVQARDVYVVTARLPEHLRGEDGFSGGGSFGSFTTSTPVFATPGQQGVGDLIGRVMEAGSALLMEAMAAEKEGKAGPESEVVVVRETDLPEDLLTGLRTQLGIVLTPERRDVTMLVVRSRQSPR